MYRSQRSPRPSIAPVAGNRVSSRLVNGVQSAGVILTFRGTLTKTNGDGTTIRNKGSLLAAFDRVGLFDGEDQWNIDPRILRYYCELLAPSQLSATRLESVADGVYELEEQVFLPFASLYSLRPRDTAFMEHNPSQVLEVWAQLKFAGAAASLVDGTAALSNLSIVVEQDYDALERALPLFQTRVRQEQIPIVGASTDLPIYIRTNNYLRALIIQEDAVTVGEVNDIMSAFSFLSDTRPIIGDAKQDKISYQRWLESRFGGSVFSPGGIGYTPIFFQEGGRLANVLSPGDPNLRLVATTALTAAAGAGASFLNVAYIELVRDMFEDPVTGRRVCMKALPFPI